jgi:hypothetical protein
VTITLTLPMFAACAGLIAVGFTALALELKGLVRR